MGNLALLLPACRYVPTVPSMPMEAVDRYGVFRGGLMAMASAALPSLCAGRLRSGGEGSDDDVEA